MPTYIVTMRSGRKYRVTAAGEPQARRAASQRATEEGLRMMDEGKDDEGRERMSEYPASVAKAKSK